MSITSEWGANGFFSVQCHATGPGQTKFRFLSISVFLSLSLSLSLTLYFPLVHSHLITFPCKPLATDKYITHTSVAACMHARNKLKTVTMHLSYPSLSLSLFLSLSSVIASEEEEEGGLHPRHTNSFTAQFFFTTSLILNKRVQVKVLSNKVTGQICGKPDVTNQMKRLFPVHSIKWSYVSQDLHTPSHWVSLLYPEPVNTVLWTHH